MAKCFVLFTLAAVLLVGCGKPEDKFVGNYTGKVEMSAEAIKQLNDMAKQFGQANSDIEAELKAAQLTLDLKDEGKCTLVSSGKSGTQTTEGTWKLSEDGKSITLKAKSEAAGKSIDLPDMVFTVSEDNKTLTMTQNQMGMQSTMTFTRS